MILTNDALLEQAKTNAEAQFQLAQLAIQNRRLGFAIGLLKIAKKQGHVEAGVTLTAIQNILQMKEH